MIHTSKKRAQAVSSALFLIGLALVIFFDSWWPLIMLVIGLPLALRQYLLGRGYDTMLTLLVFVGTYVTVEFEIPWQIFLPTLFTLGAVYIFFKEFFFPEKQDETEKEEDLNHEIEEEKKD